MSKHRPIPAAAVLVLAVLFGSDGLGQSLPLQQAGAAYEAARREEATLKALPASERTRAAYLRVIRLFERVYLITPHTGYADDALLSIGSLYEEIGEPELAVRTLQFLVREYPASRFIEAARQDIARLAGKDSGEAAPSPRPAGATVSVDNIRYWESQKSVRVVVDLSGEAEFLQGEARNPPRVFVDIANARLAASLRNRTLPVQSVTLENIRVGQYDTDTARVVLDLVGNMSAVTTFTLREPDRLVIDVVQDTAPPAAVTGVTPPAGLETGEPGATLALATDASAGALAVASGPSEVRVGTPAQPTGDGDHSLIRSLGLKVSRVVIDAGHGGHDTGTIGPTGLTEKELVLDIARRLKARIESELGAEVVMTRTDDRFVPLETRTAMANQAEADLFISIHANSSDTRSIRGFETYFLNFTTSREGLEIAARENAASQHSISELQDIVREIMLRDKVDESREFAAHVQRALAAGQGLGRDRGVKQAPFVVLIGANMPSILAEVSFISNPEDERLLRGAERRQQIAEALFDGVRSYSRTLSGFTTAQAQD